jgi:hypothetical protein
MQHPALRKEVTVLLLVGKEDRHSMEDAKQIYRRLTSGQDQPTEPSDRRVFARAIDTRLQGAELLDPRLKTAHDIAEFLKLKLRDASGAEYEWKSLKRPHQ